MLILLIMAHVWVCCIGLVPAAGYLSRTDTSMNADFCNSVDGCSVAFVLLAYLRGNISLAVVFC